MLTLVASFQAVVLVLATAKQTTASMNVVNTFAEECEHTVDKQTGYEEFVCCTYQHIAGCDVIISAQFTRNACTGLVINTHPLPETPPPDHI